ncbi:MAG: MqnA/MqnD/SBP family protein [Calditrichia bacterium]
MIRLGVTKEIILLPLIYGLQSTGTRDRISLKYQSLAQNYSDLLEKRLDAAFISPDDYGKDSSRLKLSKDIAVASEGESRYAFLFFQQNISDLELVAAKEITQYSLLTNLLLCEVYDLEPQWQYVEEKVSTGELLKRYNAVLQAGEEALKNAREIETKIDVADEWFDKTGLSFVHQVLAVQPDFERYDLFDQLRRSGEEGLKNLSKIAEDLAEKYDYSPDYFSEMFSLHYKFFVGEAEWESCAEFLKYLFYYGNIPFIPQFHFV